MIAAAVQKALREDRDGNGVPDVLDRNGNGIPDGLEQPRPVTPPSAPVPVSQQPTSRSFAILGILGVLAVLGGVAFFLTSSPTSTDPVAPQRTVAPEMPVKPVAAPTPIPTVDPSPTAKPGTKKPSAPITNEQWAKSKVQAVQPGIKGCLEQDLLRNPNVPKAYTVTVTVERDGLPRNTATTFAPTPSRGFQQCASNVIFYAFNGNGPGAPKREEFTFTTNFAFPTAKPAAKAELGRGWD